MAAITKLDPRTRIVFYCDCYQFKSSFASRLRGKVWTYFTKQENKKAHN